MYCQIFHRIKVVGCVPMRIRDGITGMKNRNAFACAHEDFAVLPTWKEDLIDEDSNDRATDCRALKANDLGLGLLGLFAGGVHIPRRLEREITRTLRCEACVLCVFRKGGAYSHLVGPGRTCREEKGHYSSVHLFFRALIHCQGRLGDRSLRYRSRDVGLRLRLPPTGR